MRTGQWRETKYPGDAALNIDLLRDDEIGMVRIQVYGPDSYMIASYLPGRVIDNPGDTSTKVEPETAVWCDHKRDASSKFVEYLIAAYRAGWKPKAVDFEDHTKQSGH